MSRHYILGGPDGRTPIPCSTRAWAGAPEGRGLSAMVARTEAPGALISTVFLGSDHAWGSDSQPLIFETLVFGGVLDGEMHRYSTWEEAEAGHRRMVDMVTDALAAAFHPEFIAPPEARS